MNTNKQFQARHRVFLLSITLFLLSLSGYRLSAQCFTTSLNVSTGRNGTVWMPNNSNDPKWTCIAKTGVYLPHTPPIGTAARVVTPAAWFVATATSGKWICDSQSHATPGINVNDSISSLTFERVFCLRSADSITFALSTHADGFVQQILVDGVATGFPTVVPNVGTWGPLSAPQISGFTLSLTAGAHRLQVVLGNWFFSNPNPAGVMVEGIISAGSSVIVDDQNPDCGSFACNPTSTDCSDICYWKVTGNNILSGNNIFGTMSPHPVRIYTSGAPVGIITSAGRFGFGGTTPGNIAEITHPTAGNSGLRFTNLTSSSAAVANPGNKVLSVNGTGDVVLVNGGSGGGATANNGVSIDPVSGAVQLGQNCNGGSGAGLTSDRVIPMDNHNIEFRDDIQTLKPYMNRVGIGTSSCLPNAKLEVFRDRESVIYDANNIAISGVNRDLTTGEAKGIYGEASGNQNPINIGGDFSGQNGHQITFGVRGDAQSQGGQKAYGGYFTACGAQTNIGVYGDACGSQSDDGSVGPNFAGYFNGNVFSTNMFIPSDRRIKKNIEPISNALELLSKIQPKKYQFNTSVYPALNLPANTTNYGVISQELELVLPSLVKETPVPGGEKGMTAETIKAVNYTELIPILIQAVKDQQAQIQEQQKSIASLMKSVAENTVKQQAQDNTAAHLSVLLTDKDLAVIDQNEPNPFDRETVIAYYLPQSVKVASVQFANTEGKVIKTLRISSRGKGMLNVYGSELSAGMYTYTLIADGVVIDTKKMQILR